MKKTNLILFFILFICSQTLSAECEKFAKNILNIVTTEAYTDFKKYLLPVDQQRKIMHWPDESKANLMLQTFQDSLQYSLINSAKKIRNNCQLKGLDLNNAQYLGCERTDGKMSSIIIKFKIGHEIDSFKVQIIETDNIYMIMPFEYPAQKLKDIHIKESNVKDCLSKTIFKYLDFTSFPGTPTFREQMVGQEKRNISINEGCRIRYSYEGLKFIDFKIEYSIAGEYKDDKRDITDYYNFLKESESPSDIIVKEDKNIYGFPGFIAQRPKLKKEFVFLSIVCLFDDVNERIIYLYYWNVNLQKELIQDMKEFEKLKQDSISLLLDCIR
jgi:hypothetical protein